MKIAHGPPGAHGVTTLMSVGSDGLDPRISDTARLVGIAASGVWAYGWATKQKGIKKVGLGVAMAALVVELLSKG